MAPTPPASPAYADPGALLVTAHELGDGRSVRLRLSRPTDADRVRSFLERLSPESRALRFLAPMEEIPASMIRHFTFYDPRERVVVVATAPIDGTEEIIGVADLVLLDTGLGEIGLVVDDDYQRHGLGKLLSEIVASLALRQGATHLKAEVADRNSAMIALMRRLGSTVTTVEKGNAVVYTRLDPEAVRNAA